MKTKEKNRIKALELACSIQTINSAEDTLETARKFLRFLNGDAHG